MELDKEAGRVPRNAGHGTGISESPPAEEGAGAARASQLGSF